MNRNLIIIDRIDDFFGFLSHIEKSDQVFTFNLDVYAAAKDNGIDCLFYEDLNSFPANFVGTRAQQHMEGWKDIFDVPVIYYEIMKFNIFHFYYNILIYQTHIEDIFASFDFNDVVIFSNNKALIGGVNPDSDLLPMVVKYYAMLKKKNIIEYKHFKKNWLLPNLLSQAKHDLQKIRFRRITNSYEQIDIMTIGYDFDLHRFLFLSEVAKMEQEYSVLHVCKWNNPFNDNRQNVIVMNRFRFPKNEQTRKIIKKLEIYQKVNLDFPNNFRYFQSQITYWFKMAPKEFALRLGALEKIFDTFKPKTVIATTVFWGESLIAELLQKKYHYCLETYPHGRVSYEPPEFMKFNATEIVTQNELMLVDKYKNKIVNRFKLSSIEKGYIWKKQDRKTVLFITSSLMPLKITNVLSYKTYYDELKKLIEGFTEMGYEVILRRHKGYDFEYIYNQFILNHSVINGNGFTLEELARRVDSVIYVGIPSTTIFEFYQFRVPQYYLTKPLQTIDDYFKPEYYDTFCQVFNDAEELLRVYNNRE